MEHSVLGFSDQWHNIQLVLYTVLAERSFHSWETCKVRILGNINTLTYILQTLLKMIIAAIVVFGLLAALIFGYFKIQVNGSYVTGLKDIGMIMSSIYNMLVLVVLMAYGLFNLPIYLWKSQDKKESLYAELEVAH